MKNIFYLSVLMLCLGLTNTLNSQTLVTHDFDDGELIPYETRKEDQKERVLIKSGAVETHWEQNSYDGTNSGRKAQFMPIGDPQFTQHIWMGLSIKIDSDYMKDNTNTNAGLMQIWGYNGVSGAANHMCMLKFDGRNGGALVWQHRYNSVANKTHYLIEDNFPRDEFVDVIIHVKLSYKDEGIVEIWVNNEQKVNKTNQTIGWGDMNADGMYNGTYCFGTSLGQYNFFTDAGYDDAYDGDDHYFDGHLAGETRTVYYDNVSLYDGSDGYDFVNPNRSTITTTDFVPDANKTYYIDSAHHNVRLAATGESEDAYTTDKSTTGPDVEWKFVDKGNGYWHIQRAEGGTKPRLRTDVSENADMQETTSSGTYTYYEITTGDIANSYFLTLADGPTSFNRLQIDRNLDVKMVSSTDHNGTWESFIITEVETKTVTETFIEAEDYISMSGIQTEASSENSDNVGWINDGDWLRFEGVNLSGISNMDARVATKNTGGTIEVRTGSATGTLIGSISVSNTGGYQNWATLNTSISTTNGIQDVYLVFVGGDGYLFNVNWIEFNTNSQNNKEIAEGTKLLDLSDITTYPNPSKDQLTIELNNNYDQETTITLYNVNGKKVIKTKSNNNDIKLDISKLNTGLYFLLIKNKSKTFIKKIVKL